MRGHRLPFPTAFAKGCYKHRTAELYYCIRREVPASSESDGLIWLRSVYSRQRHTDRQTDTQRETDGECMVVCGVIGAGVQSAAAAAAAGGGGGGVVG